MFRKLIFVFFILIYQISFAQIENVIVETYYISDGNDATDTLGGGIDIGTKTYRIFIDLKQGCKIKKVYGDQFHPIRISSTENFFNNKIDGQTFAKDFNKNRLKENTVALDTWLTIGQITTVQTFFGVPKNDDLNGSFIGGINNDGGSAMLSNGLLNNSNAEIGIPLTNSDGIDSKVSDSTSWGSYGILDPSTNVDSSIFGSIKFGKEFISTNAGWQSSKGSFGVNSEKNHVLIAQLTTKGELSFELNLEVEEPNGIDTRIVKYVANKDTLIGNEQISPFLKYPFVCGCRDANFLEYKDIYACDFADSCKTKIIFGCTDTNACNYNSMANFNIKDLCCYPGLCGDRDLSMVCPEVYSEFRKFYLFPNPTDGKLNINLWLTQSQELKYSIVNFFGEEVQKEISLGNVMGDFTKEIDLSNLTSGIYFFKIEMEGQFYKKIFLKN